MARAKKTKEVVVETPVVVEAPVVVPTVRPIFLYALAGVALVGILYAVFS